VFSRQANVHRGDGVEVERRTHSPRSSFRSPAAAIIAALSVESASWAQHRQAVAVAALHRVSAQAAVRRHAARDADTSRAEALGCLKCLIDQRSTTTR
jgi:hypothetical protein